MKILKQIIILSICVFVFTGCGKNKQEDEIDYKQLYLNSADNNIRLTEELENTKIMLSQYGDDLVDNEQSDLYELAPDGTIEAYISFNNKIALTGKLAVEGKSPVANTTYLSITRDFGLYPTDNWNIKTSSSKTELSHITGVTGEIEVYNYGETIAYNFIYSEILQPYLKEINAKNIEYKSVFINGRASGIDTKSKLKIKKNVYTDETREVEIDGEQTEVTISNVKKEKITYNLNIGIVMVNEMAIVYKFMYEDDSASIAKQEVINMAIQNMEHGGYKFILE